MKHSLDELDRMILEAVSNDYEQFDSIAEQLSNWMAVEREKIETKDLELSLFRALDADYVGAYMLHPADPHAVRVETSFDTLHQYWFYITPKGKEHLGRLESK